MNNVTSLEQLKVIREGSKVSEDRYSRDRDMYLRGRQGKPESSGERLSGRDRACYMMGQNTTEELKRTYSLDV